MFDKSIDNIKRTGYDSFMEETKEKKGRGGRRPGSGRPRLELHQEGGRAVSRTVTLSVEEWELLKAHSADGTYSTAVKGALALALNPKAKPGGWSWLPNIFAGPGPVRAGDLKN